MAAETTEYTQSGMNTFWLTFRLIMEKLALVGEGGEEGGGHAHPLSLYLPSRTKLRCTLQLRGQIHSPYF
jgi:hypothetical protein